MAIGYDYLIDSLHIQAIKPHSIAEVSSAVKSCLRRSNRLLVPPRVAPKSDNPLDHLTFAVKHEGINLGILAEVLPKIPAEDLQSALSSDRNLSTSLRKIALLWEYFNQKELRRPNKTFKPSPLFDPDVYYTGAPTRNSKWMIDLNGLGPLTYCPTIQKTPIIEQFLQKNLLGQLNAWLTKIGPLKADRAMQWAYLNETQGTYALERETANANKAERFVRLLRHANDAQVLDEEYLCELQNEVVTNVFSQAYTYRTEQNWLSLVSGRNALSVTYVPPSPEDIDELMNAYLSMVNGWNGSIDPLLAAALASFGFVYLHPFMDGNGRISRFLIHRQISQAAGLRQGVLLPVSVAMKAKEVEYLTALQTFSQPARNLWEVVYTGANSPYLFKFLGSSNLYRYWDATAQTEFLLGMAEEALNIHLREEVEYLEVFDQIADTVNASFDIQQNFLITLVRAAIERDGHLSKNIRSRFAFKVPDEALDFIEDTAIFVLQKHAKVKKEA